VSDGELFDKLWGCIKRRIPDLQIRYKDETWYWKLAPKGLREAASTIGKTIWFPSYEKRSWKVLAHKYVHVIDKQETYQPAPFMFSYTFPQILSLLALVAVGLAITFGDIPALVVCSMLSLAYLAPWPSPPRANLEERAYAMSMAINYWRYGSVLDSTVEWVGGAFTSWVYYKMMWSKQSAMNKARQMADIIAMSDGKYMRQHKAFHDVRELLEVD
jgi:hypothetical protein